MKQLTIYDILEHLDDLAEKVKSEFDEAVSADEPETVEDLYESVTEDETPDEQSPISKRLAIAHSIDDVILNTLQKQSPISPQQADTMLKLNELRRSL